MVTYRAMFKFVEGGVHAEVLDLPGVITCGATLDEARSLLQGALVDLAEVALCLGEPLTTPDPSSTSDEADLEEPIHLLLTASSRVAITAQEVLS